MTSVEWALIKYDYILNRGENLDTETDTHREVDVKTQAEHHLQAKENLRSYTFFFFNQKLFLPEIREET